MKKPVLVIMAAGMGSRYGGLKQIDPVDEYGNIIMDYSIYDAIKAGFSKIIFIIKKENEKQFKETIGKRMEQRLKVEYVFQNLTDLPDGFQPPEGRVKPWGTGHAILSCQPVIDGPFAVINADDYYGAGSFSLLFDYLTRQGDDEKYRYAMVGYILGNTLTDNGYVARGVCKTDSQGYLLDLEERTHIEKRAGKAQFTEDGTNWTDIPMDSVVSMNMWGFTPSILKELNQRFPDFLRRNLPDNPLKCEFFLPTVVSDLMKENKAMVQVLHSKEKWYGVTYKEDKEMVVNALKNLREQGRYPKQLWSDGL